MELNESPYSLVPKAPPLENILEVSSPNTPTHTNALDTSVSYVLPFRQNHGKPPNQYSPDVGEKDPSTQLPTICLLKGYLNLSRHLYISYPRVIFPGALRRPY